MTEHELDRWLEPDAEGRIDLRQLYGRPRATGRTSVAEDVLTRVTDERTAETMEALADAVPEPPRPRRPRKLSTRACVRIVCTSALLSFVALAVRYELRGDHE